MSDKQVIIYTDGSSRGNPGPGGYGAILIYGKHKKELSSGFRLTTNNRMELMAVIAALRALKRPGLDIQIYSDSQYVVNAVEKGWLKKWISTAFSGGKKNKDLWMDYHREASKHKVKFAWVKGHADNAFNNRCDILATEAADAPGLPPDRGFEELNENQIKL